MTMAAPARGSDSAPVLSDAQIAELEQLSTEGQQACEARQFEACHRAFVRAQNLLPWPPHQYYIAEALVGMGRLVEGTELWRALARLELGSVSDPMVKQALQLARRRLQEVEPTLPVLEFSIAKSDLPHTQVRVDGRRLERAQVEQGVQLDPGVHHFELSQPGRLSQSEKVKLELGQRQRVLVTLEPLERSPTKPGAPGSAPAAPSDAPAATWRAPLGWTLGGVGAAAVATGAWAYLHKQTLNEELERDCGVSEGECMGLPPQTFSDRRAEIHDQTLLSNALLFGGVGLLATGVVLLIWDWQAEPGSAAVSSATAGLSATAGHDGARLELSGSF
jgi:hypothetical protein